MQNNLKRANISKNQSWTSWKYFVFFLSFQIFSALTYFPNSIPKMNTAILTSTHNNRSSLI